MKYILWATIHITASVEAPDEKSAKEIFRQQLGLLPTQPYEIDVVEELIVPEYCPCEEKKEELEESTETI